MSGEWKARQAVKLLRSFYDTIERSGDLSECSGKTWRQTLIDGGYVAVFYDTAALSVCSRYLMGNKRIGDNYAEQAIATLVADRLIVIHEKESDIVDARIEAFLQKLSRPVPEKMDVYMCIHGVAIPQRAKIGQFEFVPAGEYDSLGIKCPIAAMALQTKEQIWRGQDHVMVAVSACEPIKAQEKACAEFQWLENAVRLFVDSDFYDIGITSFNYSHVENALVTAKDGQIRRASSSLKGSPVPLPFEKIFGKGDCLFRVIERLGQPDEGLTELQRRIRHAVYLGGLSVHETIPAVSYFLGVAAMEALFQKEIDKYVSPSVAQQIVEAFCYLVAGEKDRRSVFEQVRKFYGKRSAIAHGGRAKVTLEDVRQMRGYLRAAIMKMTDDPMLSQLKSIDDVAEHVQDKKFGPKEVLCT